MANKKKQNISKSSKANIGNSAIPNHSASPQSVSVERPLNESLGQKLYKDGWTQEGISNFVFMLLNSLVNFFISGTKSQFIGVTLAFIVIIWVVAYAAEKRITNGTHEKNRLIYWKAATFSLITGILSFCIYIYLTSSSQTLQYPTFREKADRVTIIFGGLGTSVPIEALRNGYSPIKIE